MTILVFKKSIIYLPMFVGIYLGLASLSFSATPQTHDVPMFHNDDGVGLLQDCTFMKAIAVGTITEIPTTVAGRSTSCLTSIKSVAQVLYHMQSSEEISNYCLPSAELDWLELLDFLIIYLEKQPAEMLPSQPYGVWIMRALKDKYACE